MTISLYRRYRPRTFDEVAGQDMAVDVLKKALQRQQVGHAYLFSGPRGCGKTSLARLLAKALNCTALKDGYEPCGECAGCTSISSGESLDVVEIDGASNNGVEEIRELKAHVSLSPFSSRWKVYIIDEVHMLSISAFNALLKTLEEPPSFVAFILATTEPSKVPATIRSRCQHIPFRRISVPDIRARLIEVAERENVKWEEEAVREIARQSDGALRDALSMMEQALSLGSGELSASAVGHLLGGGTMADLEHWVSSLKEGSASPFLRLEEMFMKGASAQRVVEGVFLLFRNLWVLKKWGRKALASLSLSENETAFLAAEEPRWSTDELSGLMTYCSRIIPQVRMGLRSDVLSGLLSAKAIELLAGEAAVSAASPAVSESRTGRSSPVEEERKPVEKKPAEKRRFSPPAAAAPGTAAPAPVPAVVSESAHGVLPKEMALAPENWPGFEKLLFRKDLLLYCALAGTEIEIEDRRITVSFPGNEPYCFEVLSTERNAYSLLTRAEEYFGKDVSVVLRRGGEIRPCSAGGCGTEMDEEQWQTAKPNIPLFRVPEEQGGEEPLSPAGERGTATQGAPGIRPASSPEEDGEDGAIPFRGLVEEVLKWGGGEVVLVKREQHEEEIPPEDLAAGEQ